jgi:hypothetical protein
VRAVSLSAEVYELEGVTLAARLLVDLLKNEQWGEEADVRRIPRAASAVLTLLECRMRQVARVLRRTADPESVLADHNEAVSGTDDVVLAVEPADRRRRASRRHRR